MFGESDPTLPLVGLSEDDLLMGCGSWIEDALLSPPGTTLNEHAVGFEVGRPADVTHDQLLGFVHPTQVLIGRSIEACGARTLPNARYRDSSAEDLSFWTPVASHAMPGSIDIVTDDGESWCSPKTWNRRASSAPTLMEEKRWAALLPHPGVKAEFQAKASSDHNQVDDGVCSSCGHQAKNASDAV